MKEKEESLTCFILIVALSAYVVLFADFGTEKNCYTPVSEWI